MTVGELKAMLGLLPDNMPVLVVSTAYHGLCHVSEVNKRSVNRRKGWQPALELEGRVNWQHPAPAVQVTGRWPAGPPPPVDLAMVRERARRHLIAIVSERSVGGGLSGD